MDPYPYKPLSPEIVLELIKYNIYSPIHNKLQQLQKLIKEQDQLLHPYPPVAVFAASRMSKAQLAAIRFHYKGNGSGLNSFKPLTLYSLTLNLCS